MNTRNTAAWSCLLLGSALLCTQSAHGLAATAVSLNGDYAEVGVSFSRGDAQGTTPDKGARLPTPNGFMDEYGTINFDGAGTFTLNSTENEDGTLNANSLSDAYTETAAGVVKLPAGSLTGQTLADGSVILLASTATDHPQINVLVQTGGTFTAASVQGSYEEVGVAFDRGTPQGLNPLTRVPLPTPRGFGIEYGNINFDGVSSFTLKSSENRDGKLTSNSLTDSYGVTDAGVISLPAGNLSGQVLAGGSIIVLASSDPTSPQINVLVKKGGSFSAASIKGAYEEVGMAFARGTPQALRPGTGKPLPSPRGFEGEYGTITFNGTGSFTLRSTENQDGTLTANSLTSSYSVSSKGVISIPSGALTGQVLSGGKVIVMASTDVTHPQINILVKK